MKNYLKIVLMIMLVIIFVSPSFAAESKLPVYACTSRGTAFQLFTSVVEEIKGNKEKSEQLWENAFNSKNSDACIQLKNEVKIIVIPFGTKYKMGSINGKEFNLIQILVFDGKRAIVFYTIKEFYPEFFPDIKNSDVNVNKEKDKVRL